MPQNMQKRNDVALVDLAGLLLGAVAFLGMFIQGQMNEEWLQDVEELMQHVRDNVDPALLGPTKPKTPPFTDHDKRVLISKSLVAVTHALLTIISDKHEFDIVSTTTEMIHAQVLIAKLDLYELVKAAYDDEGGDA